jgi:hypothetical protein
MEWTAGIDAYCERIAPGLLGEPANAISNAGFFLVAIWAAQQARRRGADAAQWSLIVLVGLIGAGSLAFHTFATRWAMLADVLPITAFIYGFLGFALRRLFGAGWPAVMAAVAGLALGNALLAQILPPGLLNGSVAYVPALIAGLLTAIAARSRGLPSSTHLAAAAVVLAASLTFRTLDLAVCPLLPVGTHFIWHLLNAGVLALYLEAALRHGGARRSLPQTE